MLVLPPASGEASEPEAETRRAGAVSFLSTAVQEVLEHGSFCAVAATTPDGPHCTPLVFASSGGRIWLTTSRRSVKARCWRVDPSVAGLVRARRSRRRLHRDREDLRRARPADVGRGGRRRDVDRAGDGHASAGRTHASSPATPSTRGRCPLAWTPPGRVFVGVDLERTALLDDDGVQEGRGRWGGEPAARTPPSGGAATARRSVRALPDDVVVDEVGRQGDGAPQPSPASAGPSSLPVRWRAEASMLCTRRSRRRPSRSPTPAPTRRPPSPWTARRSGVPATWSARCSRATAAFFVDGERRLGREDGAARSPQDHGAESADALVRITPRRLVWWKGWTSGSATRR